LHGQDLALGGDWPYFFRVCKQPFENFKQSPKYWTQWVDYFSPAAMKKPPHHHMRDLDCSNGRFCRLCPDASKCRTQLDGSVPMPHPIKEAGPPCLRGKKGSPRQVLSFSLITRYVRDSFLLISKGGFAVVKSPFSKRRISRGKSAFLG